MLLATPIAGDLLGVTVHRLTNGMTVYISTVRDGPRVLGWIGVRAGGRHDPPHAKLGSVQLHEPAALFRFDR